jgi:hypothetical protein
VPDLARELLTTPRAFAAGGVPDLARSLRTEVEPYALGGVASLSRSLATDVLPFAAGGVADLTRELGTTVRPFAAGGAPDLTRTLRTRVEPLPAVNSHSFAYERVRTYALGGSPHLDTVVSRPTLERAEAMRDMAIVPLSHGGVETHDGRHLGLTRHGGELVVKGYAQGGHLALFGEAGPESVMRTYRAPDGRLGVRAESGGVLPFTRRPSGRLAVEAYAAGGMPARSSSTSVAVSLSVPVSIDRSTPSDERTIQREVETAIASSREVREAIESTVTQALERSPSYRAAVRGDRA